MMRKYKIIVGVVLLFCIMSSAIGNSVEKTAVDNFIVNTPQNLLKSKKWNIMGKSLDLYYEYTDTEKVLYIDGKEIGRLEYYVSDINCFEENFDSSKVGKNSNGRFLITEESCFYITVIDNNTVQMSHLSRENRITTTLIGKL